MPPPRSPTPAPSAPAPPLALAAALGLALLAFAAYFSVWRGDYLFDDIPAIRDNVAMQQGDWWAAAFARQSPLANRPLSCLSLVLDRALFASPTVGHHVTSLLLHLGATVLVFATLRAVLRAAVLGAHFGERRATAVAFTAAAVWAVHPLGVDAVAYATQRSTLLVAVGVLTALYACVRAEHSPRRTAWRAAAVVGLMVATASKEDAVVAPLLLPLFARAFLAPSWAALRPHRAFFATAALLSWGLLAACVAAGPHNPTVGYSTQPPCTAIEWLQTQAIVVVHYLRLGLLPIGLRGCYDWPIVRELGPAVLPGSLIVALLVATAIGVHRRPQIAFLGAWFFLWLAPTSSVLPIVTELAAERRMYLPLLSLAVPFALALDALARRWPRARPLVLAAVVAALAVVTQSRTAVYRDETAFWTDAFAQRQVDSRTNIAAMLRNNYARILRQRGDLAGARQWFEAAVACDDAPTTARLHLATILVELGEDAAAAPWLAAVAKQAPDLAGDLDYRATQVLEAWYRDNPQRRRGDADLRLQEAVVTAKVAVRLAPERPTFANTLALLLAATGRTDDAVATFRRAIALDPNGHPLYWNLAETLLRAGRLPAADSVLQQLFERRPQDVELRVRVADLLLHLGHLDHARTLFGDVLQQQPGHARARAAIAEIEARQKR